VVDGPTPSWLENEQHTAGNLTITYQTVDGNVTQSHSEILTLNGNYAPNGFTLLSDPWGGTEVVYGVRQAWTGGTSDQWNAASNWSNGVVPGAADTAIIQGAGHQPVTVDDAEQVANLVIDSDATLEIANGGGLRVTNALDDAGLIHVNATGSDPSLAIGGPVRVESDAGIDADGIGAWVTFFYDQVGNAGTIAANNHGMMLFQGSAVFNQDGGVIETTSVLSLVTFDNATVTNENGATIEANGGQVAFDYSTIANQGGATIEANGGQVLFDHSTITNDESHNPGLIEASAGGTVSFADSSVAGSDGSIQADAESVIKLATIDGGEIGGEGTLEVAGSSTLKGSADVSIGQINVEDGNTLTLDHVSIDGSTINLGHAATGQGPSFTEISVPDVHAIGPAISADGEFVAFIASTTLPGQDHGDVENVAVELYDAATGKLTDISAVAPALPAGETSLGFSNVPSISADGRYVVFDEKYEVPNNQGPPMQTSEVLLYDRQSQTATVVQTSAGHAEISGDGQYIVMQGDSIPGDNNSNGESVLVTDRSGNVLTDIAGDPNFVPQQNSDNFSGAGSVADPAISSDGRFVTFWTTASQLQVNSTLVQTNNSTGSAEVYVYDRLNNTLQMVSAGAGGAPGNGDSGAWTLGSHHDGSWASSLSADGRYVVFQSSASNLVDGVGDANHDVSNIFLYDTQTGVVTAVTHADSPSAVGSIRPEISADGTHVTFASDEADLLGANAIAQTYVYDTQTQTTSIVSATDGNSANAESDLASAVSANGSAIAFGSLADNLVIPTANDGNANIYLAAPGTVAVTGDTSINNTTINDGTVIVDNCVTLTVSDVALNGTFVQVRAGANLDLLGAIHNNATLEADGGTIFANIDTTIDGTGNVVITGGGFAHFADVFNQDVTFAGPGTLLLDHSVTFDGHDGSYTGTISGFGKGDTIDLTALNYSCTETDVWNSATHTLIISNGTQTQLLSLAGSYTQDNFALARDSSGGTEVVLSPTHVTLDGLDGNGNAEEDHSVTVTPSANDLSNVTYTWLVGGQDVQDGSSNAYTPTAADVGKTLDVLASFTDPVTHSVEHVTALGGTVDALPGLTVTGTSATGSVPSSALTPTAASYLTADHDLINTLGGSTGFGTAVLFGDGPQTPQSPQSDDGSSLPVDITSIFGSQGIDFFGHQYTSLYINNNGNITFVGPNSTFTPDQITGGEGNPIIAPFWADVDTRQEVGTPTPTATPGGNSTGSDLVYKSLDTTNDVLTITWDDVGYYAEHTNLLDAFQLQLVSLGNGDFDIVFRYENIKWTTGDASGGDDGLGGTPARAGYSAGDDNSSHYFELSGSGDQSSMLALPSTTGNTGIQGVYVFQVESGNVTSAPVANGAIQFSDSDAAEINTASFVPLNGGAG
jgi:Nidogen-like